MHQSIHKEAPKRPPSNCRRGSHLAFSPECVPRSCFSHSLSRLLLPTTWSLLLPTTSRALFSTATTSGLSSSTVCRSPTTSSHVTHHRIAPWCGHCKNLAPEWAKAATALKGIVKLGALDADAHGQFAGQYGIKGFPTIKVFGTDKNKPTDYQGTL